MHVLKLEGLLFRILIPFADNDVHSSFSCLHMHFYVFFMTALRTELKGHLELSGTDKHYPLHLQFC